MRGTSPVSLEMDSHDVSLSFWDIEITTLGRKRLTVPVRPIYVTLYVSFCPMIHWLCIIGERLYKEMIFCLLRLSSSL